MFIRKNGFGESHRRASGNSDRNSSWQIPFKLGPDDRYVMLIRRNGSAANGLFEVTEYFLRNVEHDRRLDVGGKSVDFIWRYASKRSSLIQFFENQQLRRDYGPAHLPFCLTILSQFSE
jgi:hypothetical protein